MSFVHLCVHSNFSFLAGTRPVEDLVRAAAEAGMPAMALTDTDGLYAVVSFRRACGEMGVRPIYGVELTGPLGGGVARAVLLARSVEGYGEISRIVTARRLDRGFSLEKTLAGVSDDLYVLAGDERIVRLLRRHKNLRVALPLAAGGEWMRVRWRLRRLASQLGLRTVAAGAIFFINPGEYFLHRVLTAVRTRTTVGTLPPGGAASPAAFFHSPLEVCRVFRKDPASLETALEIAEDCRVELDLCSRKLPRFSLPSGETAVSTLRRLAFAGLRERMGGSNLPDGRGNVPPSMRGSGDACRAPQFPRCRFDGVAGRPAGVDGLHAGRPAGGAAAERREAAGELEYELSVVADKGLADYFLICWDIVRFARSRGMRCLGRGSAGNSLLSYALGITHVNPMHHNLFFERFLNPGRRQLPDFDIDFATDDREEVLRYIFRRYGKERVAMIGTYSTFRARAALRETAKALGIPEGEVGPLIKRIPHFASIESLAQVCAISPAAAGIPLGREPFRTLLPLAVRIGGFPRHMATHPCGLVISPTPIAELVPLQLGDKGYAITQWSMHGVEEAGLVKIDIIGQKGLAVIQEAAAMAEENEGRPLHPERIDYLGDPAAKRMLKEGRTEGCFYIESPGMMQLLRQARCDDFEVLTALSSIIRPGVSSYGGKRRYLNRHLGLEAVESLHPAVEEVLRDTYGCLVYQEQVIRIAVAVAGMSYAEADGLRRCMSYKNEDEETMAGYRDSFMRGARERGIPEGTAREIFRQIASFAGYAFCKAHSASFALESFESVYWKAHYPAEFMAAVLSNGGGYYSQEEYLEEARRMGLKILPPCVNRSGLRHRGRGRELRIGLMQVKGLSAAAAEHIVEERPFSSLAQLLDKVPASRMEVESLIRCGAMASLGRSRAALLWELRLLRPGGASSAAAGHGEWGDCDIGKSAGGAAALAVCGDSVPRGGARPRPGDTRAAGGAGQAGCSVEGLIRQIPDIPEPGVSRRVALEREILGMAVSAHPLAMFGRRLSRLARTRRLTRSVDLPLCVGRDVELVGWKVTVKPTRTTDRGEEMVFVTFSDRWGRFEAILFPEVYRRTAAELVRGRGPFLIGGRVESELGVESLVACDVRLVGPVDGGADGTRGISQLASGARLRPPGRLKFS